MKNMSKKELKRHLRITKQCRVFDDFGGRLNKRPLMTADGRGKSVINARRTASAKGIS